MKPQSNNSVKAISYNETKDLCFHKVDLQALLKGEMAPLYFYSLQALEQRLHQVLEGLAKSCQGPFAIHYAMKANRHPDVLQFFQKSGIGIDVVSGGEMTRALGAGFQPDKIIFSGVGKTSAELTRAVELSIKQINVESIPELKRLGQIAKSLDKKVQIGLRVNPDVDVKTHPYIATGLRENKFGIDLSQLTEVIEILRQNPLLSLRGLSLHIGSQLTEFSALSEAIQKIKAVYDDLIKLKFPLKSLDIGGGIGIQYDQDEESDQVIFQEFCQVLKNDLGSFSGEVMMEPGRFLVARAGVLLAQVEYVKETPWKKFLILNTGMHHFLRPALYQAKHRILPLRNTLRKSQKYDVVGPVCESSDFLAKNIELPEMREGEWVAILDTGAYGAVMSSTYNDFPPAHELTRPAGFWNAAHNGEG
ncbi:MAG: diaminopimelate decarboxylase [Oligoflexia bacterium]|nr:MAG: diaminopimelate decarboxylase [Oligoflexia bacterium]